MVKLREGEMNALATPEAPYFTLYNIIIILRRLFLLLSPTSDFSTRSWLFFSFSFQSQSFQPTVDFRVPLSLSLTWLNNRAALRALA